MAARAHAAWTPPMWLLLWATAMRAGLPVALVGIAAGLAPYAVPPGLLAGALPGDDAARLLAALIAAGPGVMLGAAYARAVGRSRAASLRATFLWAAAFMWLGVTQVSSLWAEPAPIALALWITAWVGAMLVQTWRF